MRQIRSGKDRRLQEVIAICGLGRSKIYHAIKLGDFPSPVKLYGRSLAWVSQEIDAWVSRVVATRDGEHTGL